MLVSETTQAVAANFHQLWVRLYARLDHYTQRRGVCRLHNYITHGFRFGTNLNFEILRFLVKFMLVMKLRIINLNINGRIFPVHELSQGFPNLLGFAKVLLHVNWYQCCGIKSDSFPFDLDYFSKFYRIRTAALESFRNVFVEIYKLKILNTEDLN